MKPTNEIQLSDLEKDRNGDVIFRPLKAWLIIDVAEVAIMLALRYSRSESEAQGGGPILPLVLSAKQCQDLSEALKKEAERLLLGKTNDPSLVN